MVKKCVVMWLTVLLVVFNPFQICGSGYNHSEMNQNRVVQSGAIKNDMTQNNMLHNNVSQNNDFDFDL